MQHLILAATAAECRAPFTQESMILRCLSTDTLPVIQSLWIGKELGKMEVLSIRSFLSRGHEYHLYIYDGVNNIPEGATVKNAEDVIPGNDIFYIANSYAGFSNLFRYKLLFEKAGFWADMDVICLRPFVFDGPYTLATERVQNSLDVQIASCVLGIREKGSELMRLCLERARQVDFANYRWGVIGPKLLTQAVRELGLQSHTYPPDAFCPVDWWDWSHYTRPDFRLEKPDSYALHLWHHMWNRNGVDKNSSFPNSVYERLQCMNMIPSP
jgi:hypothetical protein